MLVALTHNLRRSDEVDEAEFDSPETIDAIAGWIRGAGCDCEPVEVSGDAGSWIERLESLRPDVIFNTAEGRSGPAREALFPAVFEMLEMPYTGSDAATMVATLDKRLAKRLVADAGVPTPSSDGKSFPAIVKPTFEGSSKGIGPRSIVRDAGALAAAVDRARIEWPDGVLVEEYIEGDDVAVAYLDGCGPMAPIGYAFASESAIYDYELKGRRSDDVTVVVPAQISDAAAERLAAFTCTAVEVLGVRDVGRADFRVTPDGSVWFLEMNALPSLEPGAGIFAAGSLAGLDETAVVRAIIDSALRRRTGKRHGPHGAGGSARGRPLAAITCNVRRSTAESEAEFDAPETIAAIGAAVSSGGYDVVEVEAGPQLPMILSVERPDIVFNIAEGISGRARESQVPSLCELLGIPYTGSGPAALALSLDKSLANAVVRGAGVRVPSYVVIRRGDEPLPPELCRGPVVVKPVGEGSSMGIGPTSVVTGESPARALARELIARWRQPALVQRYVAGRELTVGILGGSPPRALWPMEFVFAEEAGPHPVYGRSMKQVFSKLIRYDVRANLTDEERAELEGRALDVFRALGCRDVARIDLRLDERGRAWFLDCNALPGLAPSFSDLCLITEVAGLTHPELILEILGCAVERARLDATVSTPRSSTPIG